MPTEHIIALLIVERDKLNSAIAALQGSKRRGRPAKSGAAAPTRKKRTFTSAQRKQQAERMKAYWRKKRLAAK
jgi:hypothetical protein